MLNQRLKYLRTMHKKNQQEIADLLGISRPAYTAYERGTRTPDNEAVEKIADYYDVSIDYLFGRTENPDRLGKQSKDEKDIAKRVEKLRNDLMNAEGLAFDGEPISDEARESLLEAMEFGVRLAKKANKKYIPKKYRDKEE